MDIGSAITLPDAVAPPRDITVFFPPTEGEHFRVCGFRVPGKLQKEKTSIKSVGRGKGGEGGEELVIWLVFHSCIPALVLFFMCFPYGATGRSC